MLTPTTLHIRQTPAGKGKHTIRLTLRRPGQPDLEGEATIKFSLTEQEQEDLRWYMEDYLQRAEAVELVTVEQIEASMRARGAPSMKGATKQRRMGRVLLTEEASSVRIAADGHRRDSACGVPGFVPAPIAARPTSPLDRLWVKHISYALSGDGEFCYPTQFENARRAADGTAHRRQASE